MSYLQALFLGIVQGLTEFLPISSSGHLVIFQQFFKLSDMLFFDVVVHVGTLAAVVVFFRRDLWNMILAVAGRESAAPAGDTAIWSGSPAQARRYVLAVVVGTIPAGLAGVTLGDAIDAHMMALRPAGLCLLATGVLLFLVGRARNGQGEAHSAPWGAVLLIGLAQAMALLPGISRSGSTICAALFLGMARSEAARFSFFLAIPAILGAAVLEGKDVLDAGGVTSLGPTLAGAAAAFLVGLGALQLLIGLLNRGRLNLFAYYCWAAGVLAIVISFFKI